MFMANIDQQEQDVAAKKSQKWRRFLSPDESAATPAQIWKRSFKRLKTFEFWRNMAIYFCIFSVVGHWVEYVYCMFNDYFFGIVDPNSGVWVDPNYPFFVYGFGVVVASIVLVPYRAMLIRWRQSGLDAGLHFFVISIFVAMGAELTQGFLQNQPDEYGNYPLWDNSQLPGNILGQAWIVNDILIAALLFFFAWIFYPRAEKLLNKLPARTVNLLALVIVIGMVFLTIYEYTTYG